MHISRVRIENYRNLRDVDVPLGRLVTLVGENNGGKSNLMRALALPLSSEDSSVSKRLSWFDINAVSKEAYLRFIADSRQAIIENAMTVEELAHHVPTVTVTIDLKANPSERYDLKDLWTKDHDGNLVSRIRYRWFVEDVSKLLDRLWLLVDSETDIAAIRMSLLPMELYKYEIVVPDDAGDRKVAYDTLSRFKCVTLPAERDGFAASADRMGSRALVDLLKEKLGPESQGIIERGYGDFFETVKKEGKLDQILNWQQYSEIPHAKDFFDDVSVMPNMPSMGSILGSIRLGYGDESLSFQGLGYRNLVLMMVVLNSYLTKPHDVSLRLVEVEEPEAHLCVSNVLLMASFFNVFAGKSGYTQLVYTTHDSEFVNKVGLDGVVVLHGGTAYSLKSELGSTGLDYLAKNPNTDIFKLLFSRRLILVEGLTEEILIKSYLQANPKLNDIKVLSFHKGFKDIIRIWKRVNIGGGNRLGVVRDLDDSPKSKREHEALQDAQVIVRTTREYTLEPEIVAAGVNYQLLREKYGEEYGWADMTADELQTDWRRRKSDVMLRICHDLAAGLLPTFTMPRHIGDILDFMQAPPRRPMSSERPGDEGSGDED